jgi:transposase-like protein
MAPKDECREVCRYTRNSLAKLDYGDSAAIMESFELFRWPDGPSCVRCASSNVYTIKDAKLHSKRNKDFKWRCRKCKYQFRATVGTFMEDSRVPVVHWMHIGELYKSDRSINAMQAHRETGISYKTCYYLVKKLRQLSDKQLLIFCASDDELLRVNAFSQDDLDSIYQSKHERG